MRSPTSAPTKLQMYSGFSGVNTSRSAISLEKPEAQALVSANGVYCDWRGFLMNERPLEKLGDEVDYISHVRHYSSRENDMMYSARTGRGTSLRSTRNPLQNVEDVWPRSSVVASSVFNRRVIFTTTGQQPKLNDGYGWIDIVSPTAFGARFSASVQNRLVLGGFADNPNEIRISRVNNENVMPEDEDPGESSVIKAFRFNIENLIGTGDEVTGLAPFESNKLAIFTNDRAIVIKADPDYTVWDLDENVSVNVGTFSHNTIAAAGNGDLLFCARSGVYSLRRSAMNGTTMFVVPLSEPISELYRWLLKQVRNPEEINAVYDLDDGRYHVFFPVGERLTYRLSLALNPQSQEGTPATGKWSLSKFAGLTCGDFLAGEMVLGSISGFQRMLDETDDGVRGDGECEFPVLWHGDINETKQAHQLVLYADGAGVVEVYAADEDGRELGVVRFELPDDGQTDYEGVPLPKQFFRPFSYRYVGVRLSLKIEATKQVRIFGIGVRTKEI